MKSTSILILLFSVFLLITSCGIINSKRLAITEKDASIFWMPFQWDVSIEGNDTLPYAAMMINCRLDGVDEDVTFQFDTGSSNSFFYENPYTYLTNKYDDLPFSIDSSKRVSFDDSQTGYVLSNVQLNSNGKPLTPRYFTLLRDYGENIADSTEVKSVHLGTIGADILENAYLLIDFPNEQLAIVDSLPESMYEKTEFLKASWNPFKLTMIHVKVNGKKKKAIFDTGSSSWTMITMKSEFEQNYGDP